MFQRTLLNFPIFVVIVGRVRFTGSFISRKPLDEFLWHIPANTITTFFSFWIFFVFLLLWFLYNLEMFESWDFSLLAKLRFEKTERWNRTTVYEVVCLVFWICFVFSLSCRWTMGDNVKLIYIQLLENLKKLCILIVIFFKHLLLRAANRDEFLHSEVLNQKVCE